MGLGRVDVLCALLGIALGAAAATPGSVFAELRLPAEDPGADLDVNYASTYLGMAIDTSALDGRERLWEGRGRLRCPTDELITYRSETLRYAVRVHPEFARRLERFDALLVVAARRAYGRAPRRLVHRGGFSCRVARGRRGRISEHSFGNALDFQGFDLPRLPRGERAPASMPAHLRRAGQVRIRSHWNPRRQRDRYHARFLHRLAETLRGRQRLFRGIVGPPRRRHGDHLHLDASPWRYAMFGYDRIELP